MIQDQSQDDKEDWDLVALKGQSEYQFTASM